MNYISDAMYPSSRYSLRSLNLPRCPFLCILTQHSSRRCDGVPIERGKQRRDRGLGNEKHYRGARFFVPAFSPSLRTGGNAPNPRPPFVGMHKLFFSIGVRYNRWIATLPLWLVRDSATHRFLWPEIRGSTRDWVMLRFWHALRITGIHISRIVPAGFVDTGIKVEGPWNGAIERFLVVFFIVRAVELSSRREY